MVTCLPGRHSRLYGYEECCRIDLQDRRSRSGLQMPFRRRQSAGRWRISPSTILWFRDIVSRVCLPKAPVITATWGDVEIPQGRDHSAATGGNPNLVCVCECALPLSVSRFTGRRPFVGWCKNSTGLAGGPESFIVVRMRPYSKFTEDSGASPLANSGYQIAEGVCVCEHLLPCHTQVHGTNRSSEV